jgi:Transglycosylase SLT domain
VIRLWPRIGVFRMLSVALLVLGVVAGVYLSAARQSQQRVVKSAQIAQSDKDEQRELRMLTADRQRASEASRSAQRDAQAKADAAAAEAANQARAAEDAARKQQPVKPGGSATPTKPPVSPPCTTYSGNQAIGCTLMLESGFPIDQFSCLKNMWNKESGWNEKAYNKSSGAGGIPQANPESKMSVYGADYKTNPATQIRWGLNYIKNKYSTPCGAWSYWQAHGYY